MSELKNQIEEARERVAYYRIKAERPGSRLEDEFALEKARTRLLTLELRLLKNGGGGERQVRQKAADQRNGGYKGAVRTKGTGDGAIRTNHEQKRRTPRERAEAAFSSLQRDPAKRKVLSLAKGNS